MLSPSSLCEIPQQKMANKALVLALLLPMLKSIKRLVKILIACDVVSEQIGFWP